MKEETGETVHFAGLFANADGNWIGKFPEAAKTFTM